MFFQSCALFFFISVACAVRPDSDANGAMNKVDTNTRTAVVLQSGHLQKVASHVAAAHSKVAATAIYHLDTRGYYCGGTFTKEVLADHQRSIAGCAAAVNADASCSRTFYARSHADACVCVLSGRPCEYLRSDSGNSIYEINAQAAEAKAAPPASMIQEHASQEEQDEEEAEGRNHEDTFWCRNYCAMCPPLKPEAERELNATNRGKRTYVYIHRSQHFLKKLVAPVHFVLNVATLGMMNKASHALFGKDSAHCPNTKVDWQVDGYGAVEFSAQLDYGLIFSKVNGPLEFLKFHAELWSKKWVPNKWNKFWHGSGASGERRDEVYNAIQQSIMDMCSKAGPGLDRDSYVWDENMQTRDPKAIQFKKMWGFGQEKKCLQGKAFR